MNNEEAADLITVKEAAYYLRIPLPTAYYLVKTGKLPVVPIGGRYRIKRSVLDRELLHKDEDSVQPTVLVVEDDLAIQSLFRKFLRKAGLGRFVVGTGAEAIAVAGTQKFSMVFLDLHLPDIPGDEVFAQLRKLYPDLPIVVVTGYPDSEVLARIFAHGPATVIQKPLEFELLNQAVKQLGHKGVKEDLSTGRVRAAFGAS